MTPAGIEPVTFRFAAQHLNHCATVVLQVIIGILYIFIDGGEVTNGRRFKQPNVQHVPLAYTSLFELS